jgi:hypothetical protein
MIAKLYFVECPIRSKSETNSLLWDKDQLASLLGSNPKFEGDLVEGEKVPQGKMWLFTHHPNRIIAKFGGVFKTKNVKI